MRLDINYKKKIVRNTNTWRLKNTFLNNQQVTGEIKGKSKNQQKKRNHKNQSRKKWEKMKETIAKINKTEIISSIFSDHNTMRLDINYKEKTVRNTNTWRLNNPF